MYVRIKTTPNTPKKAVQIVESWRSGDKVHQRIVRHVGTALDEMELKRLKDLAEYIKARLERESQPTVFEPEELAEMAIQAKRATEAEEKLPVDLTQLREEQRVIVGIHEIYGQIYKELGFDRSLGQPQRVVEANRKLYHLVMARIANPSSKRHTAGMLEGDFGIHLSLQGIYEMMDHITEERIGYIQQLSHKAALGILREKIDVIFYDCTTLYFESFTEDELKENGYSKDMKFNQPQVLLALMVTTQGFPIGYDLYPGSKFEGHTLQTAIEKIETKYQINNLIFVADSAMLSDDNLKLLEGLNKTYIVGARIKNTGKKLQQQILDRNNYNPVKWKNPQEDNNESLAKLDYGNQRTLYVTYSKSRAEKDRYDREKTIAKLQARLSRSNNPKDLISNYGYKKFIYLQGESTIMVDEEKLRKAAAWDGLHGIITNSKELSSEQILQQYHGLWQIEECFRLSKHDLRVRPIYHWTPKRVKAHIAICYIALVCIRHLEHRVATQYRKLSAEVIRNELVHAQVSILKHINTGVRYCIPSRLTVHLKKIYQVMGLKISDIPYKL